MTSIIKSHSDHCSYLFKTLSNGLRCLLIHDPKSSKSSCSVNVSVGSMEDPKDAFGLAHFVEHLLFMGTARYPIENSFNSLLNANNGSSNAFTQLDATNYHFSVNNSKFELLLNHFAHFFIDPLFTSSAIQREVKAIDHEYAIHKLSDQWRLNQLILSETNRESPFNRFNIGSLGTLSKKDIREKLIRFFNQNYSSNAMNLCMISPLSLDRIHKLTNESFSLVSHRDVKAKRYLSPKAYDNSNLGRVYKVVPVKDQHKMTFQWHFDQNAYDSYESKPFDIICSLLNSQRKESLSNQLKQRDLITSLNSDYDVYAKTFTKLNVSLELTQKGVDQYENIINDIIGYVNRLKEHMISEEYIKELRLIAEAAFNYKEREDELTYCSTLSNRMSLVKKEEDVLIMPYLYREVNPRKAMELIRGMNLGNVNVFIQSKRFSQECNQREAWFGTNYSTSLLKEYVNARRKAGESLAVKLPSRNVFLPSDYLVESNERKEKVPQLIFEDNSSTVYHKQDYTFNLPKSNIVMRVILNTAKRIKKRPINFSLCNMLWNDIISNELEEEIYLFNQAGLNLSFSFDERGLVLSIGGFNQKIGDSLNHFLCKLKQMAFNPSSIPSLLSKYNTSLHKIEKDLLNFRYAHPYQQLLTMHSLILKKNSHSPQALLSHLKEATSQSQLFECFISHLSELFAQTKFEWLLQGNVTIDQAKAIVHSAESIVKTEPLERSNEYYPSLCSLPSEIHFNVKAKSEAESNSAILTYNEPSTMNLHSACYLQLIEVFCKEKFFNELRTERTLGYLVTLFNKKIKERQGIACLIQSSSANPIQLRNEIDCYFNRQMSRMQRMQSQEFDKLKEACVKKLQMKDVSLSQEVSRNYEEIDKRTYHFSRREKQIELFKHHLNRSDLINEYRKLFLNPLYKRQLVLNFFGNEKAKQLHSINYKGFWTLKEIQSQLESNALI